MKYSDKGSPFGFSNCLDMKCYYSAAYRIPLSKVNKRSMKKELLSKRKHTHNALDDAIEQADLFCNIFDDILKN